MVWCGMIWYGMEMYVCIYVCMYACMHGMYVMYVLCVMHVMHVCLSIGLSIGL